eukprot:2125082-Rhodomonas_salina.1
MRRAIDHVSTGLPVAKATGLRVAKRRRTTACVSTIKAQYCVSTRQTTSVPDWAVQGGESA